MSRTARTPRSTRPATPGAPAPARRRRTLTAAEVEAEVEDIVPVHHLEPVAAPSGNGPLSMLKRHVQGTFEVDEWGMDRDAVHLADALSRLRWSITVGGAHHVPATGPALLVANHRPLALGAAVACLGLFRATERVARPLGLPDVAPVGPLLRRLGAGVAHPEEVAGLLRAGQLPLVWAAAEWRVSGRVGRVSDRMVAPAVKARVAVIPVAVLAQPWSRNVRVEIGPPVAPGHHTGPLAAAELAEAARRSIQHLVDEVTPPTWPVPG